MEIGGYENTPAWPKMGPSLLIATCLIVAIRTARWSVNNDATTSQMNLEEEIRYAASIAKRVLGTLIAESPSIFPSVRTPWHQPTGDDHPK